MAPYSILLTFTLLVAPALAVELPLETDDPDDLREEALAEVSDSQEQLAAPGVKMQAGWLHRALYSSPGEEEAITATLKQDGDYVALVADDPPFNSFDDLLQPCREAVKATRGFKAENMEVVKYAPPHYAKTVFGPHVTIVADMTTINKVYQRLDAEDFLGDDGQKIFDKFKTFLDAQLQSEAETGKDGFWSCASMRDGLPAEIKIRTGEPPEEFTIQGASINGAKWTDQKAEPRKLDLKVKDEKVQKFMTENMGKPQKVVLQVGTFKFLKGSSGNDGYTGPVMATYPIVTAKTPFFDNAVVQSLFPAGRAPHLSACTIVSKGYADTLKTEAGRKSLKVGENDNTGKDIRSDNVTLRGMLEG